MKPVQITQWAVVIFLAYYLLTEPQGAATAIHHLLDLLQGSGISIANFLNGLRP